MGKVPIDQPDQTLVPLHKDGEREMFVGIESKTLYLQNCQTGQWYRLFVRSKNHILTPISRMHAKGALKLFDETQDEHLKDAIKRALVSYYRMPLDELRAISSE